MATVNFETFLDLEITTSSAREPGNCADRLGVGTLGFPTHNSIIKGDSGIKRTTSKELFCSVIP
jgi:hypothetical protein